MYGPLTVTDLSSSYLPARKSSSPLSPSLHHYTSKAPALVSVSQTLDRALQSHISLFGFWVDPNQRWHGGTVFSGKEKK